MREKAAILRELGVPTGQSIFHREDAFKVDEALAWKPAAVAVKHLGAVGCYRAPVSNTDLSVFLALMVIRAMN